MKTFCFALLVLAFAPPVGAQMKQWTDDQGVVHYGNEPPRAQSKPQPQEEIIECKVNVPTTLKTGDNQTFRLAVEAILRDVKTCHARAEVAFYLQDRELETHAIGKTGSGRSDVALKRELNSLDKIKQEAPLREILLNLERVVKARHGGALPDWMKDNRDWRYLDKAFQP